MFSGKRLKQLREAANMQQQELAAKLQISKGSISRYESGIREPNLDLVSKIAEIFNVSTDYLLGNTDDTRPVNSIVDEALADDPALKEFWKTMQEREDLQLMFKKSKNLQPEAVRRIIEVIKLIEDKEDEENGEF